MASTTQLTYEDLRRITPDRKRYELIEGELFVAPAPNTEHQRKTGGLFAELRRFVRQHDLGEVFIASYDVVFDASTVLQPDVLFVAKARQSIVKADCIQGAPDLVVEVLSEPSRTIDRFVKRDRYAEFGVPEYWLVDPSAPRVEVLRLEGRKYGVVSVFGPGDTLESPTFPGFRLALSSL